MRTFRSPLMMSLVLALLSLSAGPVLADDWRFEDDRKKPYREDPSRGYQRNSVEQVRGEYNNWKDWLRAKLDAIHVTPAKLAIGVGVLGILLTLNRNKRFVHWAVISGLSWLLILFGSAAIYFNWQTFSW